MDKRINSFSPCRDYSKYKSYINKYEEEEKRPGNCEHCNKPVPAFAYDMHLEMCRRYNERFVQREVYNEGHNGKKIVVKRSMHDRKCKKCGEPCWPNYFFCTSCHSRIDEGYEEI